MKIRIYYEDTDAGGIVYHTNYIKFCERARSEIFFNSAFEVMDENSGFVVKSLDAKFLRPAKLGDIVAVKTKLVEARNASVELNQEVFRDDVKLFSMNIVLAYIEDGRVSKIPQGKREIFLGM